MLTVNNNEIISKVSLNFLFFLISTNNPKPALADNPATAEPNVIVPFISNITSEIDTAQLGINPTTEVNTGSNIFIPDTDKNSETEVTVIK